MLFKRSPSAALPHHICDTQHLVIIVVVVVDVVSLTIQQYKWATRELAQQKICAANTEEKNIAFKKDNFAFWYTNKKKKERKPSPL